MKLEDMSPDLITQIALHGTTEQIAELTGGKVGYVLRPDPGNLGSMMKIKIVIPECATLE